MERAVDGDDIALGEHLLKSIDATAPDLLLLLRTKGLVVVVEQLLAIERLEAAQDTLANAANGDGANNLALEIKLVLGRLGHVPTAGLDHLVGGHKVADQDQDGHDDMLGHRHDVGARHLGNGNTAIGLVCSIKVDMIGTDTCRDGELELLCLGETLGCEVAGMEARICQYCVTAVWAERTHGVVMMTSASTSSLSNVEFSPSLSEVVTRVWPWSSSHLRIPSSFSVVPRRSGTYPRKIIKVSAVPPCR